MVGEASLVEVESGRVPASEGWFVVNVRDAAWVRRSGFGSRCGFEADFRAVEGSEVEERHFSELGFKIAVLEPGKPSTLYHAETAQEDFLVLAGSCVAVLEGEERELRTWDFVHCPAGTRHAFVGAGEAPCVLLMVGARREGATIVYPVEAVAQARGAGVERETDSPHEAYAASGHWAPGRPDRWEELPWA
jgi:uncharacterized cupin superfamily protein